ncbi:hypothetical protein [Paenibacillus catalpae]|uniref:hypothetical protein n=1 Tax=Paenibacillus catalpae TaxID=1045775 RepID=UPI001FE3B655|nr:hypothetical protein [Paenibacillus catalpae]
MDEERLEEVKKELAEKGLEIYPSGFVTKSLITCNFCRGAEDAGVEIAQKLNRMIAGIPMPSPLKIGYAGCALGTSEPLAFAELFVTGVDAEQMMNIVQRLVAYFQANGKNKEKFIKFIGRISIEELRNAVSS